MQAVKAVIQRVSRAHIVIDGVGERAIGPGLVILLGVKDTDTPALCAKLAQKCAGLRIFDDENGALCADYSGDGVHVRAPYYVQWRDHLYRFGVVK